MDIRPFFAVPESRKANCVIFMSGSGTNARRVIESMNEDSSFVVLALVTDAPNTSAALEIGNEYSLPVVSNDIREFYKKHGKDRVSIRDEEGQRIREMWTNDLRKQLADFQIDFALLAGFVPLSNITGDFPCLNVHPGDLTYLKDGERYLIGLHTLPVERAILEELDSLRSSVIIAEAYTDKGDDMDSGHILGISDEVRVDLMRNSIDELKACKAERSGKKPKGGWNDLLEQVAKHNQELLKVNGDWIVFPKVIHDFAAGLFSVQGKHLLYGSKRKIDIETVIYGKNSKEIVLLSAE